MHIKKTLITAGLILGLSNAAQASEININVTELRSDNGVVRIGLFPSIKAYDAENPIKALIISTEEAQATVAFKNVAQGQYLIALFHDENSSGEMDMRFFGILPAEGYGFSHNPGARFGPPDLSKALFDVSQQTDLTLDIQLKY